MLAEVVLDRIDTGILVLDSDMKIVKCNEAMEKLAGKVEEDLTGRSLAAVFPRFDSPQYNRILRDCLERGQVRFCSGTLHPAFILPEDPLLQYRCRQNLQVKRLEVDGTYFVLLQIIDISDHYERVFHLKQLIKDLGDDYEQVKANGEEMRRHAYYDHLTGVYNRSLFMHQLRYDMKQAERNRCKVAVLYLDLDGFKTVNDTHGHSVGDGLLQQTAARLKECVRSTDTVARFGGDEFALIITGLHSKTNAGEVAEKIRQSLSNPYDVSGVSLLVSASIGYSLYPDDSREPQPLIDMADRAMYRVKFGGKNGVACYEIE